jgi:hypothetical protein
MDTEWAKQVANILATEKIPMPTNLYSLPDAETTTRMMKIFKVKPKLDSTGTVLIPEYSSSKNDLLSSLM